MEPGKLASELTDVEHLFSNHYFKPARVQRQYIWGVPECDAFHNDLVQAYKAKTQSDYYLGPIILSKSDASDVVWVYDGQQRLTTLTIYLMAMGQILKGQLQDTAFGLARVNKGEGIRPRLDLQTSGGALTKIVRLREGWRRTEKNMQVDWRILDIEDLFIKRLKGVEDLGAFLDWLLSRVILNVIWAPSKQGMTLFDRANNRGVKLQWHELVKSVLTEALSQTKVNDFWYPAERDTGNEFADLIASAAFIHYGEIEPALVLAKIEDEFDREEKSQKERTEEGTHLLAKLAAYQKTSSRLLSFYNWKQGKRQRLGAGADLVEYQLLTLGFPHWKAFIMHAEASGLRGKGNWVQFLTNLRRCAFIAHLLGWQTNPNILNGVFGKALDAFKQKIDKTSVGDYDLIDFSHDQLARARGTLSNAMTDSSMYRPLVKLWESDLAFKAREMDGFAHFFAQVEHILPRAPKGDWCELFPGEIERADLRNQLGNFCLLSKDVNFEMGNKDWAIKRKGYKSVEKCFIGARAVAKEKRWTPETVKKRTAEMTAGIMKILDL